MRHDSGVCVLFHLCSTCFDASAQRDKSAEREWRNRERKERRRDREWIDRERMRGGERMENKREEERVQKESETE